MAFELSDELLAAIVPVIAYWISAGIYEVVGYLLPDARLHPKEEEDEKNPPRLTVLKAVLTQQAIQTLFVLLLIKAMGNDARVQKPQPSLLVAAWQVLVAMVAFDTWGYFAHRFMHANRFAYRHVHAVHHELVVPFASGNFHSHWLDGLVVDTCAGVVASLVSGMAPRTSILFFTLATVRSVDLHCGLWLPWSPFQVLFGNNAAFHDTHHQLRGLRCNYSQPFFLAWDKLLGTYRPYSVVKRKGGGYQVLLSDK